MCNRLIRAQVYRWAFMGSTRPIIMGMVITAVTRTGIIGGIIRTTGTMRGSDTRPSIRELTSGR
jgi:hypothetical protein